MDKLPIFTTDYTLGSAILTLLAPKEKKEQILCKPLPPNRALSVFEIGLKHKLDAIWVVDEALTGFFEALKVSKDLGLPLYYGWKVSVVADGAVKNEESLNTESKVIIWLTNDQAYYDIVKYYTKASTEFNYYYKRLDWKTIQEMWTENLILSLPFYSNFISRNSLQYGHVALPDFGDIKPIILLENHELPFDELLRRKILKWNEEYQYSVMETHTIYYYRKDDAKACMVSMLVQQGGTLEKPNLSHYCSSEFSMESLLGHAL